MWTPDHPLIGRVLEGRFQIASFIREGGMAQVFCGVQDDEPRHIAIKVMHPELAEKKEVVARFLREARVAARLNHPSIVKILSIGSDRELLYMVMELLFGDDLSARVKQKGALSEPRAVEIMIDVCDALEHAHAQGVVHRDIKPENVMLCRQPHAPTEEVVKVLDFGIAKVLDLSPDVVLPEDAPTGVRSVLTRVGAWVGTPAYMSPEQGRAEAIDHRSDIYSVGVLLFELICGRMPFEGQTALQIIAKHVQETPPLPSSFAAIHPLLEGIIMSALSKNPGDRPSTARELKDALTNVLPELGASASQLWYGAELQDTGTGQAVGGQNTISEVITARRDQPASGAVGAASLRDLKQTQFMNHPDEQIPPRPAHPLIGQILADRYQIASFMREGTMAQVFCGLQEEDPKHIAIKVVHPRLAGDPQLAARFQREGLIASRLVHPNIVRVLDVGEDHTLLFMVMELLFGDDLSARIKQPGSISQLQALTIAADVLRALGHAHASGIVHRDIKPENVMLCRSPEAPERELVKVLDFGIAKILDGKDRGSALPSSSNTSVRSSLTQVGMLVGTPAYMSPEQGRAEAVDARSDIYSVGVLLYELLCGKPPFEGETALQIVARHVHEPPEPLSVRSRVPRPIETIVHRMLAKNPGDRPQSATEAADVIAHLALDLARSTGGVGSDRWRRSVPMIEAPRVPVAPVSVPPPSESRPGAMTAKMPRSLAEPLPAFVPPSRRPESIPPSMARTEPVPSRLSPNSLSGNPPAPSVVTSPSVVPGPSVMPPAAQRPVDDRVDHLRRLVTLLLVAVVVMLFAIVLLLILFISR